MYKSSRNISTHIHTHKRTMEYGKNLFFQLRCILAKIVGVGKLLTVKINNCNNVKLQQKKNHFVQEDKVIDYPDVSIHMYIYVYIYHLSHGWNIALGRNYYYSTIFSVLFFLFTHTHPFRQAIAIAVAALTYG